MSNEYENLAKMILSTPQGAKILKGFDKVNSILSSSEGTELLVLLSGGGSDVLKQAANDALNCNGDKAKAALTTLLSSPDGAALAAKLIGIMR